MLLRPKLTQIYLVKQMNSVNKSLKFTKYIEIYWEENFPETVIKCAAKQSIHPSLRILRFILSVEHFNRLSRLQHKGIVWINFNLKQEPIKAYFKFVNCTNTRATTKERIITMNQSYFSKSSENMNRRFHLCAWFPNKSVSNFDVNSRSTIVLYQIRWKDFIFRRWYWYQMVCITEWLQLKQQHCQMNCMPLTVKFSWNGYPQFLKLNSTENSCSSMDWKPNATIDYLNRKSLMLHNCK